MRFDTLDAWLRWQETLHPRAIELGLDRIRPVAERLGVSRPPFRTISVAGTNGKGSCVAYLDAALRAYGQRVGAYTSPHLLRYNERIRIDGTEVEDGALCAAFQRVDQARGDVRLTYFEFGTLAALDCFARAGVDVAVLEVGMGGRLDAVNIVDADVALITSVALDHTEWLGPDRESIGSEKAGVMRPGRTCICADREPPVSVLGHARAVGAHLGVLGRDFDIEAATAEIWYWRGDNQQLGPLPQPAIAGDHQRENAAAAIAALRALEPRMPVEAMAKGIGDARLAGRLELVPGSVDLLFDVGHNPQAVFALARHVRTLRRSGRIFAVAGMMRDKEVEAAVAGLADEVDAWFAAGLPLPRGLDGVELASRIETAIPAAKITACVDVAAALAAVDKKIRAGDLVVIFGSFVTVGEAMQACRL